MADDTRALDLDAIRARAKRAHEWATASPEPPHDPLDFVPLSVREHFGRDVPALLDEIDRLNRIVAAMAKDAAEQAEHMGELLDRVPDA